MGCKRFQSGPKVRLPSCSGLFGPTASICPFWTRESVYGIFVFRSALGSNKAVLLVEQSTNGHPHILTALKARKTCVKQNKLVAYSMTKTERRLNL